MKRLIADTFIALIMFGMIWILALFTSLWIEGYSLPFGWSNPVEAASTHKCYSLSLAGFPLREKKISGNNCVTNTNSDAADLNKLIYLVVAVVVAVELKGSWYGDYR